MNEPLSVQIRQCKSVPEALLLLATAVDELKAQRPTGGLDWDDAGATPGITWPEGTPAHARGAGHDAGAAALVQSAQQRKIAALEARIAEETDPSEVRALEATLRMAREAHVKLASPDVVPNLGEEVIAEGWASLAKPATPEQIAARMQWAADVGLEQYMRTAEALKMQAEAGGDDVQELYAWFGKVGPRGLFTADHIACLQLPYAARLWLVEHMAAEDEVLGKDMGADLLKSEDPMDREMAREMYEPTWKT